MRIREKHVVALKGGSFGEEPPPTPRPVSVGKQRAALSILLLCFSFLLLVPSFLPDPLARERPIMPGCVVPTRYAGPGPSRSPRECGAAPDLSGVGRGTRHVSFYPFGTGVLPDLCPCRGRRTGGQKTRVHVGLRSWGELSVGLCFPSSPGPAVLVCGGSPCLWLALPIAVAFLSSPGTRGDLWGLRLWKGSRHRPHQPASPPPPGRTPRPSRSSS